MGSLPVRAPVEDLLEGMTEEKLEMEAVAEVLDEAGLAEAELETGSEFLPGVVLLL